MPLAAGVLLLSACGREPEPRRYSEIETRGGGSNLQHGPLSEISWKLPESWTEQPEGDPLRLTGFWAPDPRLTEQDLPDPDPVDVSLVQLAGDAGGLEANVTRWLGQVGIPAAQTAGVISAATTVRTATGQEALVVDFTNLLSGDLTQSKSIVGAIITAGGTTVFVKAMGQKAKVARVRPQLVGFVRGLSIGEPVGGAVRDPEPAGEDVR